MKMEKLDEYRELMDRHMSYTFIDNLSLLHYHYRFCVKNSRSDIIIAIRNIVQHIDAIPEQNNLK